MDKDFSKGLQDLFLDGPVGVDVIVGMYKNSILSSSTTASFAKDIESGRFLEAYGQMEDRFVPQIDFSIPSNFAKFGSATKYYEDAYIRTYNQYPYDGSQKEKVLWNLSSTYIDKYIFENIYPRTNGYITIGAVQTPLTGTHSVYHRVYNSTDKEYIYLQGGPNADQREDFKSEIVPGQSIKGLSKANVYDTGSFRESNLKLDLYYGNTVEFWLKKDQWINDHAQLTGSAMGTTEYVFDLWNSASVDNSGSGGDYGRLSIYVNSASPTKIYTLIQSGAASASYCPTAFANCEGGFDTGLGDIADGSWHHYALVTQNSGTFNNTKLYVDGAIASENSIPDTKILAVTGAYVATIGSQVRRAGLDTAGGLGWGKLSGSIDEFRFWKTARNAKEIGRFYIDQVNGGTNTDSSNTKLGVYYKFNEGITQTSSVDSTVLDYSGRISNGIWTGYDSSTGRSTGSAIVLSSKATREFEDPIIYSSHPTVKSTLADLKIKGDLYDFSNSNSLINSLPSWIVEDDLAKGPGELHKLIQILSSYLDTLYLQIEALPTIKNINYASSSAKPHFFNNRLLVEYGFDVEEILTDVDLFAYANTRDDDRLFEQKLYNVKNQIYKNIYNNLIYIYKTKGTEKSFNNLMHAMGFDQELVRLNVYGFNTDWRAQTNTRMVSLKTKYADFYNNNEANVYGHLDAGNSNSTSYISGSNDITTGIDRHTSLTIESEVVFPKYLSRAEPYFKEYTNYTSSLFGMHSARSDSTTPSATSTTDMTWADNDSGSFQVYAIRKQLQALDDNPEVYFMLTGSTFGELTSSAFRDVYDNSKWNFAVRLKHKNYPQVNFVSGSGENSLATVEFYGVEMLMDAVNNEFTLTGTFSASAATRLLVTPKRIYCGAHRTNFTGSVLANSDAYISHLRLWNTDLSNDVIKAHSRFGDSYGTDFPYRNTYLFEGKDAGGPADSEMPQMSSLALDWNFEQVTGSDSSGRFTVADFSSGSNSLSDYKLSNVVQRQHTARGDFFEADSSGVVDRRYMPSSKLVPFDQINSSEMVSIVDFEGEIFTRETRPSEHFFSFEKSMYANISDEILNLFATIKDFHNLVGDPVNRYRKEYKQMEKFREVFFRRVNNVPDLDKFLRYYKWIDSSISNMLTTLVPATANFADRVYTVIESHVLERNKIETKFPVLELNQPEPVGQIKAINELLYDWEHGYFPVSSDQSNNCLYWKDRAERTNSVITSGDSNVDSERDTVKRFANSVVSGSTYVLRKLTRPYRFAVDRSEDFNIDNIKLNFAKTELDTSNKTESIILQNLESFKDCNDDKALKVKRKVDFQANVNGRLLKGRSVAPFAAYSSSISSGYIGPLFLFRLEINDNHRDVYGTETQEPLQGPFSKIHVGGKKSRKVTPLTTNDRAEEYNLAINPSNITLSQRTAISPKSKYFLDEIAKRPVVIKNIKTSTSSLYLGNYSKEYQIVQTVGADTQRGWLKDNFGSVTQLTPEVLNLSGNLNFNTFARTGSSLQSVTVADRFSAPGSPETISPGYLDPASHTFSVYNGINYRNMTVRLAKTGIQHTDSAGYQDMLFGTLRTDAPLNTLHRDYMTSGGYDAFLTTTASIHKVNRNRVYRMESSGSSIITGSNYDNFFIQHPIPQSARQYSWITESATKTPLGYSTSSADIIFVTASDISAVGKKGGNFNVDFDNLNTLIYDPLDAATNFLSSSTGEYRNTSLGTLAITEVLNSLINHRRGPYGWPTWKQIRGGSHPVVRNHRLTNTFSTANRNYTSVPVPWSSANGGALMFKDTDILGGGIITNLTETVVTNKYKPIHLSLIAKDTVLDPDSQESQKNLKFTYGNSMAYFANEDIFKSITSNNYNDLYAARTTAPKIYKSIANLYLADKLMALNPIKGFNYLEMKEVVWPRAKNTFLNRTRTRNNYTETSGLGSNGYDRISHRSFWRKFISDRLRTDTTALNSQGYNLKNNTTSYPSSASALSVWPTEGRWTGSFADAAAVPSDSYIVVRSKAAGELFNGPNVIIQQTTTGSTKYFDLQWLTASCKYHGVDYGTSEDYVTAEAGGSYTTDITASSNINWTTNIDSGRNPWYDSYEEYSADLSKIGKDYSIIPEFNISDHMPLYVLQRNNDFTSTLPTEKFNIQGINNSASTNTQFYDEYSHSDFLKNFDIVIDDHKNVADIKKIQMTCYGLKKLLPYNGFYPVTRTVQLATLLSQSYANHISGTQRPRPTASIADYTDPLVARQAAFLQPFFAPGILYNTIKSGIAVDWPAYTGSSPYAITTGEQWIVSASNYRLPFETLYDFSNLPIFDVNKSAIANKIYAASNFETDTFFTWNGNRNDDLYERAMNNFLAESVNLFIKDSRLTSFVSKPMKDIEFKEGVTYRMSIDLEMITGSVMTEGMINGSNMDNLTSKNFQRRWRNKRGAIYGPAVAFFTGSTAGGLERQDPAFAPYTPPYFYGKATVDLAYTNTVDDTPKPSLATIFNNMTASYSNNFNNIPTASYDTGSSDLPLRHYVQTASAGLSTMMHLSSSLKLFGKVINPLISETLGVVTEFESEDVSNYERWVISTKFESPVLNFNHYTDDTKARGMWNGYGNIPNYSSEGVRITLRDTDPSALFSAAGGVTEGSLVEKMFFAGQAVDFSKPIGQLPIDYEKSISECIVAIPFFAGNSGNNSITDNFDCVYSADDDKYFFALGGEFIPPGAVEGTGQDPVHDKESIINLRKKMKKFVFPPRYDFENSKDTALPQFVMFAFEFKHHFTRQELADIWQGVMPDISMKVVPETSTLSVPVAEGELMNEFWSKISDANVERKFIKDSLNQLRWMVFKVKQRAKNIYANITEDISDDSKIKKVNKDHIYSYNWPYDYCSLVELAKIETDLLIDIPDLPSSESTPEETGLAE